MKSVLRILLMLLVTAYLVIMLGFADKQYDGILCNGMEIIIHDSLKAGLVNAEDVKNIVQLDHPHIAGTAITSIESGIIEENLNLFPAISDAQVYTTVQGRLMIEVIQRTPVARIEDENHQHYYLDSEGYIIPAVSDYSPHVLYMNGEIPGKYRKRTNIYSEDEPTGEDKIMDDLLRMARYIQADPFWTSQIQQVYLNGNGEFELVPLLGSQIIFFGNADRMEYKFFKLGTLYREGFSHTGWNQYKSINLKYNNQVICTKI